MTAVLVGVTIAAVVVALLVRLEKRAAGTVVAPERAAEASALLR